MQVIHLLVLLLTWLNVFGLYFFWFSFFLLLLHFCHIFFILLFVIVRLGGSLFAPGFLHVLDVFGGHFVVHLAPLLINSLKDFDDLLLLLFVRIRCVDLEQKTKFDKLLGRQVHEVTQNLVNSKDHVKQHGEHESDLAAVGLVASHPCRSADRQNMLCHAPRAVPIFSSVLCHKVKL